MNYWQGQRLRLNHALHSDLQWWATFLETWNDVSMLTDQLAAVHFWTDASCQFDCGGWVPATGLWFQLQWPPGGGGGGGGAGQVDGGEKEQLPIILQLQGQCGVRGGGRPG